ncbi:MAG TPA: hydroxyisourate hydrolase [Chthoniobacterales bacterium]
MAGLTTHVLDITRGIPATGMKVELFSEHEPVKTFWTNAQGRTDAPLLTAEELRTGKYELVFHVGDYFAGEGIRFLDRVPIWFGVADVTRHYHVPLSVTPWAYQTYRGS